MHHVYQDWLQPGSKVSCCDNRDCRPTRAYLGEDGRWRAWDGQGWIIVPPAKLLPSDLAKDGRNHLCASPSGEVYCFSPTSPKG